MKVLDLAEFFSERGGGVRAYLTQLLREGAVRGHQMVVVAPGPRDEDLAVEGGRIVRLRGPAMPYDPSYHWLTRVRDARALITRERPDVLQASAPYIAAPVVATLDAPLRVLVVHSDFLEAYARPVLRALVGRRGAEVALRGPWSLFARGASRFDLTVVAGPWLAEKLRRHGVPRVACVPFGIDHARFSPAHRSEQLRAELLGPLARDPAARLVVLAGRLAVEKRAALALKALARVHREIPVSVLMLGDGPERPRLEALAARLGLCAQFTGFLKDRERYARCLASADVLVHACAVETFGFVVAEALASGTPVVVPDAGGAADFVDDACAERFDHDGGEVAAAVAIVRLLRRPPGALRESAVRAGARVPAASSHFDALFALYARCLRDGVAKALEDA